jgi:hypothetical protein
MAIPVKGTMLGFITSCAGLIAWTYKQRILELINRGPKPKTPGFKEPETNIP